MRKKFLSAFMLGALTLAATSTFVSCKDYDGDISALKSDVSTLQSGLNDLKTQLASKASELETKIATLQSKHDQDLAALKTELQGEDTKLQNAINALQTKHDQDIANLNTELAGVKTRLATCEAAIADLKENKADKSDVEAKYAALTGKIDEAKATLQEAIDACNAALELQKEACDAANEALQNQITANKENIAKNLQEIAALKDRVKTAEQKIANNTSDIASLRSAMTELNDAINAVNWRVNVLEILINKRLTAIVFAPTTYIHGIEAINFTSLKYQDWGTGDKLYADAPATGKFNYLSDNKTKVNYYLNPTSTKIEDIQNFTFIDTKATNTRAGEPILEVVGEPTYEAGKLTLTVQKNTTRSFAVENVDGAEKFDIVALKAVLNDKDENGANLAVYSDWARLAETECSAYIHDARLTTTAGDPDCDVENAHFSAFTDIYTSANLPLNTKYQYNSKNIAIHVPYNEAFNLATIVNVCDKDGHAVDAASFGLAFKFALVEYNVLNENQTQDATNQSNYATITEAGVIKSQAKKGETMVEDNRDAIGKTPVVQVQLVDTKNNAVVDVRYFRVEFDDVIVPPTVEERAGYETEARWVCGELYTVRIGEDWLNSKIYAEEGANGMTQEEFHDIFQADAFAYDSKDAAIKGDARNRFAQVVDKASNSQSTQAHNLLVAFNSAVELTEELYNGTPKTIVAWVRYTSLDGKAVRVFPVSLTVSYLSDKIAPACNYNASYWSNTDPANADKYVTTNATLTTNTKYGTSAGYKDAQMINNLLNNYINEGVAPSNVNALLSNSEDTKVIFDKERLAVLPESGNWKVSDDCMTLLYKEGSDWVPAVVIVNEGNMCNVKLVENPTPGKNGQPTKGGLLLVNYDKADGTATADIKNAVPVKLIGTQCELEVVMDKYLVRFEQPLTFSKEDITAEVEDQITSTSIKEGLITYNVAGSVDPNYIDNKFAIKEVFGQYRTISGNSELEKWYILEAPDYKPTLATTNLQKDGTIGSECNVLLSDLKNSDNAALYQVDIKKIGSHHYVQFQNLHGNALQSEIKVKIPVTVNTKWRKNITYYVDVTVKPNLSVGGAK